MDARDSSPSSTTARNASPATTDSDDAVSNVTVSLAKDAASHFQSSKFAECVEVLNQLLHNNKQHDPKVLHNIAIAEHFRDDCSDPKKLLELLSGIKKKSDELALASVEQEESVNSMGNKVVLGSQGRNDLEHHFSGANSITMYTDEFNSSVATLNIAIIWFHLHDYAKTLAVLEPLFQNIEPINEQTIALHICLLLLDASLACHDASKSADVLAYLEKALGVGNVSQGDNGNTTQEKSTNQITKSSSVPNSASIADASNLDLEPSADASENNLSGALSDDSLDYEAVLLGMGRQSLRRPLGPSPNDILKALVGRFSTFDLKLRLQLYKVRFLLLTRNLKLAKREVKLVMNIAHGRDLSMALLLKSQLEYARGNHHKAIKLLMASSNSTDAEFSSMFNNNLGCIYFQLGKLQTSSLFFTKALTNISSVRKDQPLKLATFSRDNSLLIIYNSGLQYLLCKKPIHAAHCFQKASLILYRQPLLWLRLSECCLMALENGLIKSSRAPSEISEVDVCVVGNGKWRQLVVEDQGPRNGHMESYRSGDCCLSNDGQLKLSMSLARQCLLNVLLLLDSCSAECLQSGLAQVNSNMDTKEQKGGTSKQLIQNSLSYYEGTCRKENQLIKQAVLANLAYVELELDNPVKALLVARLLLEIPECSRIYVFLGHVYAAEALCLLNRPKEAAEHLSFYLSGVNTVELPFISEDIEKWQMESTCEFEEANRGSTTANNSSLEGTQRIVFIKPEEARATIYANFAAMSARQGDLARAQILITEALSISPNCPEATLTAVFVDLLLGKSQEALAKLKHCSRIRFLPSGIALKKSS
ncbi:PREDICTED: CCR4-NOT transcription complex subunit 10-like isoform X5 [Lupinus angustifolius]|uniref:CCR4-NOT transcription complex subunit 10-like isoform X5 n=1 Tax=Lupinus angustifolius TaxID=3871 RepID=UPI00092F541A|nr:PREDICTED: CCR4-NOT transcription complex subunit 10-like isoform X5 [Lupinus angustifolius]